MSLVHAVRRFIVPSVMLTVVAGAVLHAQSSPAAKPKHPPVCAQGVRMFTELSQIPVPHDSVQIPPADGPIRVTSPEEAEAAELALRGRAGSVGATGVLITDETTEEGGGQRVRRRVAGIFAPADSARAQAACKK
jgi:hypothetical protein